VISILCTSRSGSTNLSLYLQDVLNINLINSPFLTKEDSIDYLKKGNLYKLMIHRVPVEYNSLYDFGKSIINLSDKVILYDRKNKIEQAESLAFKKSKYKDDFTKYHTKEPYDNLDNELVDGCLYYYKKQGEVIKKLSEEFNIPIFWYEDIYYENGIEKLSNYLNIKINNKSKKRFLDSNKKERIINTKNNLI